MSAEENKALVRRWFEAIDRGDFNVINELLDPDYVDYNPPMPDQAPGREGVRQSNMALRTAFKDVTHIIEDQLAEGDKVMTRVSVRATFVGEFMGFAPTGKVVEMRGIAVHRIANGRMVEHWAQADWLGLMQQVRGGSPLPGA
jgi:steroid delta-isomerase-like uncharacterized protein